MGVSDAVGEVDMRRILVGGALCMVGRIAPVFMLLLALGCASGGKSRVSTPNAELNGPVVMAKFVIHLTHVPPDTQKVAVAMFADPSTYLSEDADYSGAWPFDGNPEGRATIVLEEVAVGGYAVIVLADTDGDERIGQNALGLPTESYGFGNNATGFFGPASFKDALVEVKQPVTETRIAFVRPPFGRPPDEEDSSQ